MEELTKMYVDWKKIAVVGMLVVLTGIVSASGTWYVAGMGSQSELEVKDNEIATLRTNLANLEAEGAQASEATTGEAAVQQTTETKEATVKTLSNSKYMYSFEYPNDYTYINNSTSGALLHSITFVEDNGKKLMQVDVYSSGIYKDDFKRWFTNSGIPNYYGTYDQWVKPTTVNGIAGLSYQMNGAVRYQAYAFLKGDYIYRIQALTTHSSRLGNFNSILNTLSLK